MAAALLGLLLAGVFHPPARAGDTAKLAENRGALIVGVRDDSPPFSFIDPRSSRIVGIEVDLAEAIAARLNAQLKLKVVTSQTWIPYLLNGDVDLVAATVTRTPDRAKLVDFSLAYFRTTQRVLARKGSVTRLEDLRGKRIGTTQGHSAERNIRNLVPSASCYFFTDTGKAVEALRKGEIDALSATGSILYGCLSALPAEEYEVSGAVKLSEDGFRMAVRKGDRRFLELVNSTLSDLNEKGDAKKIFDKWFHAPEEEGLELAAGGIPQAIGVVTRPTSAEGRYLVIPIEGIFRPDAAVSIFDPQGNPVGEGTVASIYLEETYVDARGAPPGLIQPGFAVGMGYDPEEARRHIRSRSEVIDRLVTETQKELEKERQATARRAEQDKQEREKYQEDITKSRMYLDYQYSDYYYRYRW